MKIVPARATAELIRFLYKLRLVSLDLAHRLIDILTVRVIEAELKEKKDDSDKR